MYLFLNRQRLYFYYLILFLYLVLNITVAIARTGRPELATNIQSDTMEVNLKTGNLIYRGNVIITRGLIKITGEKAVLFHNSEDEMKSFKLEGHVFFEQKRIKDSSTLVNAMAKSIEYDIERNEILLIGDVKLSNGMNSITADSMIYNTIEKILNVGEVNANPHGQSRVNILIRQK